MGFALVLEVLGQVDRGHAAGAKFSFDGIAVRKGGFEAVQEIWHCVLALLVTVLE